MATPWVENVQHVQDGERVSGGVDSRPTRQLDNRTAYLRNRMDNAELGKALFNYDVAVSEEVNVGSPVYYNAENQRFEPALAAVENDEVSGAVIPAKSAEVLGVCYLKSTATIADILVLGTAALDLTAVVTEELQVGYYYLSAQTAGKLTSQRPAEALPVLFAFGDGQVFVTPTMRNFLDDHIHYSFDLSTQPSGTAALGLDNRYTIAADGDRKGWLPADHPSFNGAAPSGAKFGYNLIQHPEVNRLWPPLPLSAAQLFWDTGDAAAGSELLLGANDFVRLDAFGIWWMTDCFNQVPWVNEAGLAAGNSSSLVEGTSSSSSLTDTCPQRSSTPRLVLSFAKLSYATDRSVVTSLQPYVKNGPLSFVNAKGEIASVGALYGKIEWTFLANPDGRLEGDMAFKAIVDGRFVPGFVTSGLVAADESITLSGGSTRVVNGETVYYGLVKVRANIEPTARLVDFEVYVLSNAVQRELNGLPYLGMLPNKTSSLRMTVRIPLHGLPENPLFAVRLWILGLTAGDLPSLSLSYRKLSEPDGATSLPSGDTALTIDTTGAIGAQQYLEATSDGIAVEAGDLIVVTLTRNASDGYSGEVGLIDPSGVITASG